jgi:hypothetical protein
MHGNQFLLAESHEMTCRRAVGPLAGPSNRAVRRHARRHGLPTLADQLAYWQAQRLGRQFARGGGGGGGKGLGWPAHVRITLVLVFLFVGLTVGALFS